MLPKSYNYERIMIFFSFWHQFVFSNTKLWEGVYKYSKYSCVILFLNTTELYGFKNKNRYKITAILQISVKCQYPWLCSARMMSATVKMTSLHLIYFNLYIHSRLPKHNFPIRLIIFLLIVGRIRAFSKMLSFGAWLCICLFFLVQCNMWYIWSLFAWLQEETNMIAFID
jgi:hypothetical protein